MCVKTTEVEICSIDFMNGYCRRQVIFLVLAGFVLLNCSYLKMVII